MSVIAGLRNCGLIAMHGVELGCSSILSVSDMDSFSGSDRGSFQRQSVQLPSRI